MPRTSGGIGGRLDSLSHFGAPLAWQRFHAAAALYWLANNPAVLLALLLGVGDRVLVVYLIFVSLLTAFSGEMAALHGVTVQKRQEDGDG